MSQVRPWTSAEIPDLSGKRVLLTGATTSLGERTVLELARHGANIVVGDRDPALLEASMRTIEEAVAGARLQPLTIDVSDLSSVRRAVGEVQGPLDLLIHHAEAPPSSRTVTADGLHLQMAANHFGPFALTGLLWPQLVASGDGRVVAVGSPASRIARGAPLEDPREGGSSYGRAEGYAKSKLAHLMFVLELDRRARDQGVPVRGLGAHAGYVSTRLGNHADADADPGPGRARWGASILQAAFENIGQPSEAGPLPVLMAATADLPGSTCIGPGGPLQLKGQPQIVSPGRQALDRESRRRLWEISEEVTGVRFLSR